MNQRLRQCTGLLVFAVVFVIIVPATPKTLRGDEMDSLSPNEQCSKFVDEWFERLSEAEPQSIATEFAAMAEAASEVAWADRWPLAVAIRMVEQDIHFEHAAAYLLDYAEPWYNPRTIDLNQKTMDRLVPAAIDFLQSPEPAVFPSGRMWVAQFQKIPDQYSADIRGLIWDWTDDPVRQVAGCRLVAQLANVTQADRDAIVACLESPDNIVEAALQAAATIGDTELLPEIQKRLNHVSDGVSVEAATAMLQIIEGHPNDASLSPLTIQALETFNKQYLAGHREEVLEYAKRVPRSMLSLPDLLRGAIELPAVHDRVPHVIASAILKANGSDALPLIGEWLADSNTPVLVCQRLLRALLYIEADQSALHPVVLQQLQRENEEVRTLAIRVLTQYGNVDARQLVNLKITSETSRLALILALGRASDATRQVAIDLLPKYLADKSPDVRVAAAASLLKLGDGTPEVRQLPGQLIEDLDKLNWDHEWWNGFETLKDLTKQIRPSPDGLSSELLRAAQACPKPEPGNDSDAMENDTEDWEKELEQIGDRAKRMTIAQRAAELLASLDDSAFDARLKLSQHFDGEIRRQAILQLGVSGDPRALLPIVAHLFDRSTYSFMISNHTGGSAEMRIAAIEALASPQLDASPIASMLCDLLEEDWAAVHAAQALGRCQSQSEQILARLKDIKLLEPDERAIAIGATVAQLEKDDSRRWQAMLSVLRLLRKPQHAAGHASNSYTASHFLLETLQSLHRERISIEPLRAELEFLAINQPCLDFETRAAIVTILAEISPNDPRWLNMLKFWRAQEDMKYGPADLLIDKLPHAMQDKIR